ncbi:MAG: arginase family protein [Candidatus Pacearchaeota archaeon]
MLIVKVPFINGLGKTIGCEKAPSILVKNDEEIIVNNDNIKESTEKIYKEALRFLKTKEKVLFIGGDHSISYPLVKAFSKVSKKKKCLVVFDAHVDCMPRMKEPTHEEWLRAVIEENLFDKIFLIGGRKVEPEEASFLKKRKEVLINSNLDSLIDSLVDCNVYLSIDIDVFDPAIAPGTGYREKKGLKLTGFYRLLDKIKDKAKVVDLVEVNPEKDLNGKTIKLARKIILRLMKN